MDDPAGLGPQLALCLCTVAMGCGLALWAGPVGWACTVWARPVGWAHGPGAWPMGPWPRALLNGLKPWPRALGPIYGLYGVLGGSWEPRWAIWAWDGLGGLRRPFESSVIWPVLAHMGWACTGWAGLVRAGRAQKAL